MKIVLAEKVSPATLAILQKEPGWNCVTADKITDLPAELADADALIVRSAVQADAKLLAAAPKLRIIGRAGVGVDNIDAAEATKRGIVVMNTPGANAVAVAELTLGLMISMCRKIPQANAGMHQAKWDKKSLQGSELRGKTLGIIGCGRIGLEVARRAKAFGMELLGYDPFIAPVIARENGITLVPIDDIFGQSDYLSLHVGLTPQTEGLINQTSIAIMKKGIRIINCARGELIVDEALAEAIKSGHVAGAALDVFRQEPLKDSPYFGLDNVLLSPHIAGSTDEAQEAIGIQLANQVRDYLKLGVVQNAVNVASLTEEEYAEVSPYIEMANRLGKLLGHAAGSTGNTNTGGSAAATGSVESISLTFNGRLAQLKTDMIRNAAIAGVLHGADAVNRINASAAAAERGIRVQEDKREHVSGGTGSTLRLALHWSRKGEGSKTDEGTWSGVATVLHGHSPRLLSYDGIDVEAELAGTLVIIRNQDVPGVIGRIGTILGEAKLNIANFALGRSRNTPGGQALAVVQLDTPAQADLDKAIADLRKVESITSVRVVELGAL
ncbi:phosphoglycerate dehydrogenase [Granulicella sp. 5B5]|uniref:phosphoglycerate dehydrogenase n=1 Tax=Granulicella sp. 5B5 TaxID=1617967 RepID=UPI0015F566A9|nr:phosphoglycerate dehydrogenase [Granulicella sp. 5B5]QMV18642.1 phosphoglycerate dehydrogenase [Granulicella sp. 5B5]